MKLWPHQVYALERISDAMDRGVRRILVTSPTGGGKTVIMFELVRWGLPAIFYLIRRMLLEQFAERLDEAEIGFGYRANGFEPRLLEDVQLAMTQTDYSRVCELKKWELHRARLVFWDECHDQKGGMAGALRQKYDEAGATQIGFSATPIDCGGDYDEIIVAGTQSELRACGALVPAVTYAPHEPATPKLRGKRREDFSAPGGSYSEKEIGQAMKRVLRFGNIFDNWRRLNPDGEPTIGFAHAVDASLGHALDFHKRGVPVAHIDGENTWIRGEWYNSDADARRQLRDEMQSGEIAVTWNRFVLREGIDWPFVGVGILATIFSSIASYLQAVGRILRKSPELERVKLIDFGGNWWRHGSPNADRFWELTDSKTTIAAVRKHRMREKKDPEPIVCSKCQAVRTHGKKCEECGHQSRTSARFFLQGNGKLVEMSGDIFAPRRRATRPELVSKWVSCYWRAARSKNRMTFAQAEALFAKENNWQWPSESWPFYPRHDLDLFRPVAEVDRRRLNREETAEHGIPQRTRDEVARFI